MVTLQELKVYIPSGSDKGSVIRKNMPQIDWKHLDDLLIHLKDDYDISHTKKNEDPRKLKASQSEFSKPGVEKSIGKGISKSVKPLLVGSDNKIVDGHHRWLAAVNTNVKSLPIIRFNKPASEVIKNIKSFKKVKYKSIYNKNVKEGIQEMKTTEDDDGGKHLVMQLRKVITLAGKKPVEFGDGTSTKVDPNVARRFLQKYMGLNRPAEKEKLQAKAYVSYDALKKCLTEETSIESAAGKKFLSKVRKMGWSVYSSRRPENEQMYEFEKDKQEFEIVGSGSNWELYDSGPTLSGRGKKFDSLEKAFQSAAKINENSFNKWKSGFNIRESAKAAYDAGKRDAERGKAKANASDQWAMYAPDYHKGYGSVKKGLKEGNESATDKIWNFMDKAKKHANSGKSSQEFKHTYTKAVNAINKGGSVTAHIDIMKGLMNEANWAVGKKGWHVGSSPKKDKFKVGDVVVALKGLHKGVKHKIIHVNGDGSYNIAPHELPAHKIKYRLGAAKSQGSDLKPLNEASNLEELFGRKKKVVSSKSINSNDRSKLAQIYRHPGVDDIADDEDAGFYVGLTPGYSMDTPHGRMSAKGDGEVGPFKDANDAYSYLNSIKKDTVKEDTQVNEISPTLATRFLKAAGDRKNPNSTYGKRKKGETKKALDRYGYMELARTKGGKVLKDKKKKVNEVSKAVSRLAEASDLYHKTFSAAVAAAVLKAEKQGHTVDSEDISDALGKLPTRGRPSVGKTTSFKIPVTKKGQKKKSYLQIQVYGMDSGNFELNSYI